MIPVMMNVRKIIPICLCNLFKVSVIIDYIFIFAKIDLILQVSYPYWQECMNNNGTIKGI
jgi:hypothetical protein